MRTALVLGQELGLVDLGDTLVETKLRVDGCNVVQTVVEDAVLSLHLDDADRGTLLGSRKGAHGAGVAATHDNEVGLNGVGDLRLIDNGSVAKPSGLVGGASSTTRDGTGLVRASSCRLGLLGTGGNGRNGAGSSCASDERTTRDG